MIKSLVVKAQLPSLVTRHQERGQRLSQCKSRALDAPCRRLSDVSWMMLQPSQVLWWKTPRGAEPGEGQGTFQLTLMLNIKSSRFCAGAAGAQLRAQPCPPGFTPAQVTTPDRPSLSSGITWTYKLFVASNPVQSIHSAANIHLKMHLWSALVLSVC